MSKATKLSFETIENPFNNNLDRVDTEILNASNKQDINFGSSKLIDTEWSPEGSKKILGNDLNDLWISSWIKSRSYKPKVSGFKLDGKTGKIECTGLDAWGGTITGATLQTGTSGERVVITDDNIILYDSNDIIRVLSDNGYWAFLDSNEDLCGTIGSIYTEDIFLNTVGDLYLSANSGSGTISIKGDTCPNDDAVYDLGSRPLKWEYAYLEKGLRFDYTQANFISVIDDSDNTYMRIRFDASAGSIGFGRTIYPITNDSYDLGVTTVHRWKNVYMVGNVYFETTVSKGFIWDAAGDNAQFWYNNTDNRFVFNKTLNLNTNKIINVVDPTSNQEAATKKYVDDNIPAAGANTALSNLSSVAINTALLPAASYSLGSAGNKWNNLYMTGSIVVGGTVDGVDIANFASLYNTHVGSANSHHAQSHSHGSHTSIGANDHHAQSHSHGSHTGIGANDHHSSTSNGYAITPASYVGGAITCNSGSMDQTNTGGRIRQYLCGLRSKTAPGNPASGEVYIYYNSSNNNLEVKFSDGAIFILCNN